MPAAVVMSTRYPFFADARRATPRTFKPLAVGLIGGLVLLGTSAAWSAERVKGAAPKAAAKASAKSSTQTTAKAKPAAAEPPDAVLYGSRPDVVAFAEALADKHGWPVEWAREALAGARFLPRVTQLIMPPPAGTAKNWAAYRARFVEPRRIEAGQQFWREHATALQRAEATYGVPASLVVGIIGVETFYGRHTGGFRVLDALATLSFDFPTGRSDRSAFFRDELEQLLLWCRAQACNLRQVKGSYAGAIGWPQFMPGSINRYAVDFDGDGRIDLERSVTDAIGSVAHYLQAHGWRTGEPTHFPVAVPVDTTQRAQLLAPDILPTFSVAQMRENGAALDTAAQAHEGPLALVELQNGDAAPSYVAGTRNFYAVTRYNWSSYYAMAVIDLGAAVEDARRSAPSTAPSTAASAAPPAAPLTDSRPAKKALKAAASASTGGGAPARTR